MAIDLQDNKIAIGSTDYPAEHNAMIDDIQNWINAIGQGYQLQGELDASAGSYPASPSINDAWLISVAGTISGISYAVGDVIVYSGSGWINVTQIVISNITGDLTLDGDLLFSNANPAIIGADVDGGLYISGGSATGSGANIILFGESHANVANDIRFRSGTTVVGQYDSSATKWNFQDNDIGTTGSVGIGTNSPSYPLHIVNSSASRGLFIDQNNNGIALFVDSESTTSRVIDVLADAQTSGDIARFYTNSSSFSGNGVKIDLEHASSSGTALQVKNDGTGNAVFIDNNGSGNALYTDGGDVVINNGDLTVGNDLILAQNTISSDDTEVSRISGGTTTSSGGNILLFPDNHATSPGDINFRNQSTSILRYDADNNSGTWEFNSAGGVEIQTGNLGIGGTPSEELEIFGSNPTIRITDTDLDSDDYGIVRQANGTLVIDSYLNSGAGTVVISTGNSNVATFNSTGLGIGTTPSAKLHVDGTIKLDGNYPVGTNNVALGDSALTSGSLSGGSNTAIGSVALSSNTAGSNNVAIGKSALNGNTTGTQNSACGTNALFSNTTGSNNTANGTNAARNNTTGTNNTACGYQTLYANTTADKNTAYGRRALFSSTTGSENTATGYNALYNNTTGNYNTASGSQALFSCTTGSSNSALGSQYTTAGIYAPAFDVTTHSNRVSMAHTGVTNAYIQVAWSVVSDERDKTNFAEVPYGLDFVAQLNPVAFQFRVDRDSEETKGGVRYGFKAQDILALEGDNPVIIDNEDADKLRYNGESLVPVLVNAIKDLKAEIDALKDEITILKSA